MISVFGTRHALLGQSGHAGNIPKSAARELRCVHGFKQIGKQTFGGQQLPPSGFVQFEGFIAGQFDAVIVHHRLHRPWRLPSQPKREYCAQAFMRESAGVREEEDIMPSVSNQMLQKQARGGGNLTAFCLQFQKRLQTASLLGGPISARTH